MSLQAIKMIFEFLPRSYHNGAQDPVAREKMHNAATIAGRAAALRLLQTSGTLVAEWGLMCTLQGGLADGITLLLGYSPMVQLFTRVSF
jgi:acetaldehyde dehydrogenase/alcohol dehydrogenase